MSMAMSATTNTSSRQIALLFSAYPGGRPGESAKIAITVAATTATMTAAPRKRRMAASSSLGRGSLGTDHAPTDPAPEPSARGTFEERSPHVGYGTRDPCHSLERPPITEASTGEEAAGCRLGLHRLRRALRD